MKNKILFITFVILLSSSIIATSVGKDEITEDKVVYNYPIIAGINYSVVNTNSSDFWDDLDTPLNFSNILASGNIMSDTLNVSGLKISSSGELSHETTEVIIADTLYMDGNDIDDVGALTGSGLFTCDEIKLTHSIENGAIAILDSAGSNKLIFDDETLFWNTLTSSLDIAETMSIASGSITDSSGSISFGDENIFTTGNIGIGDTTPEFQLKAIARATDGQIIDFDGQTNDYTGGGAGIQDIFEFRRDLNTGNREEAPEQLRLFRMHLLPKHTNADLSDRNIQNIVVSGSHDNNGATFTNPSSTNNRWVYTKALEFNDYSRGTFVTTGGKNIAAETYGTRSVLSEKNHFDSSGGGSASQKTFGYYIQIDSKPVIDAGTLTHTAYGIYMDIISNGAGTDSAFAHYIGPMTGWDTSTAIYDDSGSTNGWTMDYDGEIKLGEEQDSIIEFDGNSLNIVANKTTAGDDLEIEAESIKINGQIGWTGTFTNGDGATVTVLDGLIVDVS